MCEGDLMATNLQLDDKLIKQAVELGGHHTKKEAVTQALSDYVRNRQQEKMLELFGNVDFVPGYDYKKQRAKV
jgi:Arc/MetJ family transcription regulator